MPFEPDFVWKIGMDMRMYDFMVEVLVTLNDVLRFDLEAVPKQKRTS